MIGHFNAPGFCKGVQGVVVNGEYRPDGIGSIALITAGQVPGNRNTHLAQTIEYACIAPVKLIGRQPAAQRIVNVRVGAGLIEHQIAVGKRSY